MVNGVIEEARRIYRRLLDKLAIECNDLILKLYEDGLISSTSLINRDYTSILNTINEIKANYEKNLQEYCGKF